MSIQSPPLGPITSAFVSSPSGSKRVPPTGVVVSVSLDFSDILLVLEKDPSAGSGLGWISSFAYLGSVLVL